MDKKTEEHLEPSINKVASEVATEIDTVIKDTILDAYGTDDLKYGDELDKGIFDTITTAMSMYKSSLNPRLIEGIEYLAKEDPLLGNALHAPDLIEFANRLMAVIPLIVERERANQDQIRTFLETNPHVNRILNIPNDTPELPPIGTPQ